MPRVISRPILQTIRSEALAPLEILEIATSPPYTVFEYFFVNNLESLIFAGQLYTPLGFSRGEYESELGDAVDRVTFTLDDTLRLWGRVATFQVLNGSRIRLRKVFLGYLEFVKDSITIFDGSMGAPTFDEGSFAVEVRAISDYQDTQLPTRTFQPGCNYYLGESRCGVDTSLSINRRTVRAQMGSTRTKLVSQALRGLPAQHWTAGYVICIQGPERGQVRPIATSYDDTVTLLIPFMFSMDGSMYQVQRGCRKTKADCADRFMNLLEYGGFAEVPVTPRVPIT